MNESEETKEQSTLEQEDSAVLKAIAELSKKIDGIEKKIDGHDVQFEAIRQGLVANSAAFDRLEAVVYESRSDVSKLRANVKDLTEEVHLINKSKTTLELKN